MRERIEYLLIWARSPKGVVLIATVLLAIGSLALVLRPARSEPEDKDPEKRLFVDVKRVMSGQKLKLDNDQDEYLMYAGIRAPYNDEPLFKEATTRNEQLVAGKKVRLRFDDEHRDADGRLLAYVFVEDTFVNEVLVREGLAYARLTTTSTRFGKRLLAAQAEARTAARGIWRKRSESIEFTYSGDPKYGNFHRPACDELAKIKPERLVTLKTGKEAFEKGFAPCSKCKP